MKKYICTVCGYIFDENDGILWENLPNDWLCPLCGADKAAFEVQEERPDIEEQSQIEFDEELRELQSYELAAICSNLSKGCEKQYLPEESKAFLEIANYYENEYKVEEKINLSGMLEEIDEEIKNTFNKANGIIDVACDRGSKRSLIWSEKVTRMLKSVLNKYEKEGHVYLEDSKVYVCEICGFIYIGDELPKVCPVCKVPNFKMKEIGRD